MIYDLVSKEEISNLSSHSRPVVTLDIHPKISGKLVSGSVDGYLKVWGPLEWNLTILKLWVNLNIHTWI